MKEAGGANATVCVIVIREYASIPTTGQIFPSPCTAFSYLNRHIYPKFVARKFLANLTVNRFSLASTDKIMSCPLGAKGQPVPAIVIHFAASFAIESCP